MAPLTPSLSAQGAWSCVTCNEDYDTNKDIPWEMTEMEALLCVPCIRGRFEQALENDYSWPPSFGGELLDIADFKTILSEDLFTRLTAKAAEVAANVDTISLDALKDQTRGKDYQVCPKCSKIITLADGCNHIVCLCLTGFCFICGVEVAHNSDHFRATEGTPNTCPRFGRVDDDRAIFDDPLVAAADEVAAMEAHVAELRRAMDLAMQQIQERERQLRAIWAVFNETHLARWAWNVAMQNSQQDPIMQELLRNALRAEQLPVEARTRAGRRRADQTILAALREHNHIHAVEQQEWEAMFDSNVLAITEFLHHEHKIFGMLNAEHPHPFLHDGLLLHPVALVFNMMEQDRREAALEWMYDTLRDYTPETHDGTPLGAAVFSIGPGGDANTRVEVARLLRFFRERGEINRFKFTVMQGAGVLVTIQPPRVVVDDTDEEAIMENMYTPPEGYWRVELLHELWGFMVHLDSNMGFQPVFVPLQRNWGFLMRAARGAYLRQDPERAMAFIEWERAQR